LAGFITLFMACKETTKNAMVTIRAMRVMISMLFLVRVRKHAHIVMQRTVGDGQALRHRHAQQKPRQHGALEEVHLWLASEFHLYFTATASVMR
jgi:hypothetical protein